MILGAWELLGAFEYLRIIAGVVMVLFLPGYFLQAAVFPRRSDLDGYERAALSCGLSIGTAAVIAPVLDRLPWGIRIGPTGLAYLGVILIFAGIGAYRRKGIPEGERYECVKPGDVRRWWQGMHDGLRRVLIVQTAGVFLGVGVLWANAMSEHPGEAFTEFAILGPEGRAQDYPREARVGEVVEVECGIANHEGREESYRIEVRQGGVLIGSGGAFVLGDGEKVEAPVRFRPVGGGDAVRIDFWLVREAEREPYRTLELWLGVKDLD